jgi:cytochrome c oxidase subunit 1
MYKGPKAPENPWESTTLEWTVPSPPPFDNFGGKHPVVYHDAYEYGDVHNGKDYVMQTDPAGQPAKS